MTETHEKTGRKFWDPAGFPLEKLRRVCIEEFALPRYKADQIFAWIHGRNVLDFSDMTDLSKNLRILLAKSFRFNTLSFVKQHEASDGVVKGVFETHDGLFVETVIIPEGEKVTQCISTQVGCRMGCLFCATARMGFNRNLTAGEIVGQAAWGRKIAEASGSRVSNLVYMGMGEPLDNYEQVRDSLLILLEPLGHNFSTRKITLSTVGNIPGLQRLGLESFQVNLAVSVNSPTQDVRARLMPAAKRWPLPMLMETLGSFPLEKRRRITVEYVLLSGVNDSSTDAKKLALLFRKIPCKMNLIRINPFPGCAYEPPTMEVAERFQDVLRSEGYTVFLRKSRGAEIQAGCGQLAASA